MSRLDRFLKLKTHPYLKKVFAKLKKEELDICLQFLKETESLNKNDFAFKTVRMFLGNENKPKNWSVIEELLISSI